MPEVDMLGSVLRRHRLVLIAVGLAVGCAAKFVTGSLFVFNVYQDAIKDTFNYSETEVELLSSMLNLGLGVGFLPGMFYDRFGPQWTSLVGLAVSVGAYMLVWSTTKSVKFYTNAPEIMAVYFFLCGLGSTFTYMVALNTNIINFGDKHTGKVVGLLNAFFAGSPSVFSVIYYHIIDQNFTGFMLLFAISFGIVDILCVLFLKVYKDDTSFVRFTDEEHTSNGIHNINYDEPAEDSRKEARASATEPIKKELNGFSDESTQTVVSHANDQGNLDPGVNGDFSQIPLSLPGVLLKLDYQLFAWMFAFSSCIGLVAANNVTTISKSLHLDRYDDRLTVIIPVANAINSALTGFLSDYFVDKVPRLIVFLGGCVFFLLSQILVILFADKVAVLGLATAVTGLGISIIWTIGPTIMKEMFYIGNLGRNWGMTILLGALLGLGAQEIFGALYDEQRSSSSDLFCYGMNCIRGGTAVNIALASLSIILGLVLQFKRICFRQRT